MATSPHRTINDTRAAVASLRADGLSLSEIARRLGVSKSTAAYHVRRLGVPADERFRRRYDWAAVQRYHDEGHSAVACIEHFGCSSETWYAAVLRGALRPRARSMPVEELLSASRSRGHIKKRLIAAGLKDERCEVCGLTEWRGAPLALQLHHVNGVGDDNRLENLQLLCPNCHSQTENWGGRNKGSRSGPDREAA